MKLLFEGWRKYLNEALSPDELKKEKLKALERLKQLKKHHDDLAKQPLTFEVEDIISNETEWTGTTNGTPVIIPARTKLLVRNISSTTSISVSLEREQELEIPQSIAKVIKKDFVNVDETSIIQIGGSQIRKSRRVIDISP